MGRRTKQSETLNSALIQEFKNDVASSFVLKFDGSVALNFLPSPGCAPSATEGGFSNPAPGARVYAIEDAVKYNRREQIPQIVECLCSDDELVRFMAIGGLQRMTGQDLGYKFDDPDPIRLVSYRRWRQWTIDEHLAPPEQAYSSTMYPPSRPRPQW